MTFERLTVTVRKSLWFIPVTCALAGGLLSVITLAIDRRAGYDIVPKTLTGGPDTALAILTTVAASMVTLIALVLTITMVVVQLAMGQFSPRIVQTFLRDKPSQLAVGLFVATFAHAMLTMREVRFDEDGGQAVPGIAIVAAYVLIVISIVVLVLYVHHIGQSLRVSALIELVGDATRKVMDTEHPQPSADEDHRDPRVVTADRSAVVNGVDARKIVRLAASHDITVDLVPAIGSFVPAGAPLFCVDEPVVPEVERGLRRATMLGLERSLDHDMAYGFRMLVDVAERSIAESPFLDPTTAIQAIDRLHDCLRQLARRPSPTGEHCDDDGVVRLRVPTSDWDDYVHLAFDELVIAGRGSPPVRRHLRDVICDLRSFAPPSRRPVLDDVLLELEADDREPSPLLH